MKNRFKYLMISFIFTAGVSYGGEMEKILEKCPGRPNCVVSLEEMKENSHYIEPLSFGDKDSQEVEKKLTQIILSLDGKIVEERDGYIKAEFFSKTFKFKDVAEFLILPEKKLIMVRSAAETGWSDFGVNRKRIEKIRDQISKNN